MRTSEATDQLTVLYYTTMSSRLGRRLGAISSHVTTALSNAGAGQVHVDDPHRGPQAAEHTCDTCKAITVRDNYANVWSIEIDPGSHTLLVIPAGSKTPIPVATPPACGAIAGLAADDNGYVWITDGARGLFRLNPRGPPYGPPGRGGGVEYSAPDQRHTVWHVFDSKFALPDGSIASLECSGLRDCAIVTLSTGATLEVSMDAEGLSSVASVVPSESSGARWEVCGGRLPCGNHDIYAAECGGKVYVSGGALWYRGFPARMAEFDELWVLNDPSSVDARDAWSVVPDKMPPLSFDRGPRGRLYATGPGSRCYNGLAALEDELWVVGGCCSSDGIPNNRTPQDSCVVYNIVTKAWQEAPSLNYARSACVAGAVGGRIYCMGSSDVVESIHPSEDTWRVEGKLPFGAGAGASCVLDEKIFIVDRGGVFAFDPAAASRCVNIILCRREHCCRSKISPRRLFSAQLSGRTSPSRF